MKPRGNEIKQAVSKGICHAIFFNLPVLPEVCKEIRHLLIYMSQNTYIEIQKILNELGESYSHPYSSGVVLVDFFRIIPHSNLETSLKLYYM